MRGTGEAEVFVMLAHPVGHAKSLGMFNEIFEREALDSLMVPLSCRPEDFYAFRAGLTAAANICGAIVSVPYKTRVFENCADAHDRAARVRSADPVRRLPDGRWYAGPSIARCLAEAGAAEIRLSDADRTRADTLAWLAGRAFPTCRIAVVNATPVGVHAGDPLPLDAGWLVQAPNARYLRGNPVRPAAGTA